MKKLLSIVLGALMVSTVTLPTAFATYDFGQIGSGGIYSVRNVSDNQTDFAAATNADLCETVQFKVRIHNAGPKTVTNVKVKATLPTGVSTSHTSTVAVTADNNRENAVATGSATVNLSKAGSISYIAGSTELLDANGGKVSTLGDTILTSGVNIGSVGVSLNNKRYVQFQAKTNCEPPVVKNITVCELATKKIITIDEKNFDASKHSKNLNDCKVTEPGKITVCETATKKVITIKENEFDAAKHSKDLNDCAHVLATQTPEVIAATGPTSTIATVLGLSAVAAGIGYAVQRRRNILG